MSEEQMYEWPKDKRIALAIPCAENVPSEAFGTHLSIAAEISKYATLVIVTPVNVHPHDAARMDAIESAFERQCDYLMFVDDDTIVPKGGFGELYRTILETKAVVVNGHYYRRGWQYTCVWSKKINGEYKQVDAGEGVHEIDCAGLGCSIIDLRWVLEHMKPPFFRMLHNGRCTTVTDDVTFFEDVRASGGLVLGNANVRCGHLGGRQLVNDQTVVPLRQMYLREVERYNETLKKGA